MKNVPQFRTVSVEPPPKQGCEDKWVEEIANRDRLSGTPAEAGVRAAGEILNTGSAQSQWNPRRSRGASFNSVNHCHASRRLSGTPAEAGVRVIINFSSQFI